MTNTTQNIVETLIATFGGFGLWNDDETGFDGWKFNTSCGSLHYKFSNTDIFIMTTAANNQLVLTRRGRRQNTERSIKITSVEQAIDFVNSYDAYA